MRMLLQVLVTSHLIIIMISLASLALKADASAAAKPGCPETCGNLTIPYPFGMGKGCFLSRRFEITCNMSSSPPRPLLRGVQILQISENYLLVNDTAERSCFNNQSGKTDLPSVTYNISHHFSYSRTQNKFIAIGCDIYAFVIEQNRTTPAGGCASLCPNNSIMGAGFSPACSGIGCCKTNLQTDVTSFDLRIRSLNMLTPAWAAEPCSLAFIAEGNFSIRENFNLSSHFDRKYYFVPAILEWSVGDLPCLESKRRENYACGRNAECVNSNQGRGYRCQCSKGYQGNPYFANGCQDVDECKDPNKNLCVEIATCTNTPAGSYSCTCPTGYHGDGNKQGPGCMPEKHKKVLPLVFSLGVGITIVPIVLITAAIRFRRTLLKTEKRKIKRKFFKKNGGLLLQQQISSSEESVEKTKLYPVEELEKATDGFNSSRIIGKGGLGTVYKGMLSDGTIVAIKKSNTVDEKQVEQFVNEVFILSQINHRHIVKLLGCCLETEVPLLVYEHVSNGTLSHQLHGEGYVSTLSWKDRLRIGSEIAGALAYLHSYASISICHRDIKSSNILLDDNLRAVVSDFGLSRSIPLDKTHLTALVQGTFGYLDPDYFRSGQFTDKSDVFAFGVVLAELLTGEPAVVMIRSEQALSNHFKAAIKQNDLFKILDKQVANEGRKEEIYAVAKIAKRCLKLNGKKRPTMKEVAIELQQLGIEEEQSSFEKTMVPEQSMQRQTCQDSCRVTETSYTYTVGPVTDEIVGED